MVSDVVECFKLARARTAGCQVAAFGFLLNVSNPLLKLLYNNGMIQGAEVVVFPKLKIKRVTANTIGSLGTGGG